MSSIMRWLMMYITWLPVGTTAFIYECKVLRKWDMRCGRYHYFIGLSDFHDKAHPVNKKQQEMIDQILAECDKKITKIILEDLSSRNSSGHNFAGDFVVNSRGGILGGLATACREKGFEVENVEYRFCRVSALGPVLNNLHKTPYAFPSVKATRVTALAQEIDVIMQEIGSYNDGHELGKCYKQCLHAVEPHVKQLKHESHADLSVADYLNKYSKQADRLEFLKHLLTFDSGLLDIKMVHAVINAHNHPKVVAISGGAHIARVSELLQSIGYQQVYATDVQFKNEYDLNKCLGSTIVNGSYCVRPEPIELEAIKKFM